MEWTQQITNYQPSNDQEQADKQAFLYCIEQFEDVLTRNNPVAHVTCSGFVMNKARDHVLMIHHNIYNAWGWTGGHADGETDFLQVALREVMEETGVQDVRPLTSAILSLDVLTVLAHVKKGVAVAPHVHLNVTYVLEAPDDAALVIQPEENSAVAWIAVEEIATVCNEPHMVPIYQKMINKVHALHL